jgi:hypothetical protein
MNKKTYICLFNNYNKPKKTTINCEYLNKNNICNNSNKCIFKDWRCNES